MSLIIICIIGILLMGGLEARPSRSRPSPPSPSPPLYPSPPSPFPPSPPINLTPQVVWASFARDCKDIDGKSTRRGAPKTVVGAPSDRQMAVVAKGTCGPSPSLTWYSPTSRSCFLEAFFGTRPSSRRVSVRDVSNLTLLVLNKGTVRPIIDGIDIIVLAPSISAPPPSLPPPATVPPRPPPSYSLPMPPSPPAPPGYPPPIPPPPWGTYGSTRGAAPSSYPLSAATPSPATSIAGKNTNDPPPIANAVMLPIFRVFGATTEELRLSCPDFNRFRLAARRGVAVPQWYDMAEVLGVRITVRGPGADVDMVTTVGIGAIGLELRPSVGEGSY